MRAVHDVATVRAAEAELMRRLPVGALMQRAAAGLARRCAGVLGAVHGARVVLLVGDGNNGADAMWAGVRLTGRGARVDALLVAEGDPTARAALTAAGGRLHRAGGEADRALLADADLVVDGMVGIGGSGALRPPAARLAELVGETGARVVAVDVPSGVAADSGIVEGVAVRADVTVTFGTRKPGLVVDPGAGYAGLVELVDIGLGPHLPAASIHQFDAPDVAARLPTPVGETTKYTRGVLGVVAGSAAYPGAAVLTTGGALRAGAGMVRYVGVPRAAEVVGSRWPEAVVTVVGAGPAGSVADPDAVLAAGRVQAWVVGPGMGTDADPGRVLGALLDTDLPLLIDADGLGLLVRPDRALRDSLARRSAPTLLTPHAGEFARLFEVDRTTVESRRLESVRRGAAELGVSVLLKGSTTLVADPDGATWANPTGTPWLATAGSGDVLSGACGALLAGGLSAGSAGTCGAFLHGLAGILAATGRGGSGRPGGAGSPGLPGGRSAVAPVTATDLLASWPAAERLVRSAVPPVRPAQRSEDDG